MTSTNLVGGSEQPTAPDPYLRQDQIFPKLTDDHILRAKEFGTVEDLAKGTALFERGDNNFKAQLICIWLPRNS